MAATNEMLNVPQLCAKFPNVKSASIRKAVERGTLIIPANTLPKLTRKAIERAAERKADEWVAKGEEHRRVVFDVAHDSLKLMHPKAPRNFREAEAADKMARRAAGLDVSDTVNQTLININEAMAADEEPRPVEATVEAEVVEESPQPALEAPVPAAATT